MSMGERIARIPTGAKIFLTLISALFPLAIIAFFANLSASRQAGEEARSQLRVAASESSHNLSIELVGDMTALISAMNALSADHGDTPSCARLQGVFAQQSATGAGFFIADRQGRLLCGAPLPASTATPRPGPPTATILPEKGLILSLVAGNGDVRGSAFFPTQLLASVAKPSSFTYDYEETLRAAESDVLVLHPLATDNLLDNHTIVPADLGIGGLRVELRMRTSAITWPTLIAMILPFMMWVGAASIAWFVVDRLLIRPLQTLRASVAAYQPGETIDPAVVRALPAQEIRELGETFRSLSRTLVLHEAGLAEGLVRQTRLTREVHHRVKNNLQVISSLINLHSRGAKREEVVHAYASIQRRVDALSVVHRHHFAEMEDSRGLSLRAVIGELASNIRATAAEHSGLAIQIEVEPFLVTQDNAIAVAFLLTEIVELAISITPAAHLRISVRGGETAGTAVLRISSPALTESEMLRDLLTQRYGRVMEGLARQMRAPLHHDPLSGAYEIALPVTGRD
jgi:two-component system, sensor histidine kinase PdtaS